MPDLADLTITAVCTTMLRKFQDYSKIIMSTGSKSRWRPTTTPAIPHRRRARPAHRRRRDAFIRFDLKPFFENPKLPVLQPDPMRGGLTELRKIAAVADTWIMTIAPHPFPEFNVLLLASVPNGLWIEDMGLGEDLWIDPVPVKDRTITAPERPGHGLAFKPEILRGRAVKHSSS